MKTVLEARNITKDFPGVRALDNVSFSLKPKQIHALCGENGAGKSTLINVLSGFYPKSTYTGDLLMEDQVVGFKTINDAENMGIAVIHQELNLFNELTVTENLFLGHEIHKHGVLDWNEMYAQTNEWIKRLKLEDVDPKSRLGDLGVGKQQLIEIARALRLQNVCALILDEPTAALTENETEILLDILRELRDGGTSIIYVSHKLDEVMEIADYVTVFRDGTTVGGDEISKLTQKDIIKMMVGRDINDMYPDREQIAQDEVIMEVKNFSVFEHVTNKIIVDNASFELRKGEILGIFGLSRRGTHRTVKFDVWNPDL